MSIATEVTRLTTLRNNIRSKLIALGIISDSSADLQDCYEGIYQVPGRTYADTNRVDGVTTVPSGYYDEPLEIDSFAGTKYYLTGANEPTSSLGNDGDLYLQISGAGNWYADNFEYMSQVYRQVYALANTDYNTWTPSTTAAAIKATVNATTFTASMTEYEYLLRWRIYFEAVYNSGTTPKAALNTQSCELLQTIYRRPSNRANFIAGTYNNGICETLNSMGNIEYYNSSGTLTSAINMSYGIYGAATAATFSSATAASPTVTVKTPAINARCSNTYFATGMASAIDKTNSKFIIIGDLYRSPIGSIRRTIVESLRDMHVNPPSFS